MSLTREQFDAALKKAYERGVEVSLPLVLRDRVFRTGRQRLIVMDGHLFMCIQNRSYVSMQRVPLASLPRWLAYFAQ